MKLAVVLIILHPAWSSTSGYTGIPMEYNAEKKLKFALDTWIVKQFVTMGISSCLGVG